MLDRHAAVDPNGRLVVDGAEVKDEPVPAVGFMQADLAAVPDHVMKSRLVQAGQLALGWVRYDDLAPEGLRLLEPTLRKPAILVIEGEPPPTAQVDPAGPAELRAGVARALAL